MPISPVPSGCTATAPAAGMALGQSSREVLLGHCRVLGGTSAVAQKGACASSGQKPQPAASASPLPALTWVCMSLAAAHTGVARLPEFIRRCWVGLNIAQPKAQLAGCHSAPNVRGVAGCCSSILDEEPSSKAGVLLHCSGWWEPPLCACKWSRPGLPSLPLHSELLAGGFGGASLWEGTMRAGHGAVRAQMCSASSYHVFRE